MTLRDATFRLALSAAMVGGPAIVVLGCTETPAPVAPAAAPVAPPDAPLPSAAPGSLAAARTAPCGFFAAQTKAVYDGLTFRSHGRVTVHAMGGLELDRAYVIDGHRILIDGGLVLHRTGRVLTVFEDGASPEEHFRSAGGETLCDYSPEEIAPTCFHRAEDLRRIQQVAESQAAHEACCTEGNVRACGAYGALLLMRGGDPAKAVAPLELACRAKQGDACGNLARLAQRRGDEAQRQRYLDLACQYKDAEACAVLIAGP